MISLIIATYNSPAFLNAVLRSVAGQQLLPHEVIIADDGSTDETRDLINAWQKKGKIPIRHVYQQDKGFRLSRIRNRAVAVAEGDYIVFIDGDCLLRPGFVREHARLAEPGYVVVGNRVLCSREFTQATIAAGSEIEAWWPASFPRGAINRRWALLRVPLGPLRKIGRRRRGLAIGCNLAMWRRDFISVNGFDETFVGWGLEDEDIVVRLQNTGIRQKSGRLSTTVLHLWHALNKSAHSNQERFEATIKEGRSWARIGLQDLKHNG